VEASMTIEAGSRGGKEWKEREMVGVVDVG